MAKKNLTAGVQGVVADWRILYATAGVECDVSSLVVPDHTPGFDRLLIIPRGLTPNRVVAELRKHFEVWTYHDDLDAEVVKNYREPTHTYAIWVRNRVEADKELRDKSADDLARAGIHGITLLERLAYEWKYFSEALSHLDTENFTLCSGSRDGDGDVPCVDWCAGSPRLRVDWCGLGDSYSGVRARAVVS